MIIKQIARAATDFQQPVDEHDLRLQLEAVLTHTEITRVSEIPGGHFNNTYQVHTSAESYILKVAPVTGADVFYNEHQLMQRERSLSSLIQAQNPLVPAYISFFSIDGRDAFLQECIEGRLWHDEMESLSDRENNALWTQLGEFASTMHGCKTDKFGYPASLQGHDRWSDFILENVNGLVEDCHRLKVFHPEIAQYLELLAKHTELLDGVNEARLCHGDLWPRNVIIDGSGEDIQITAVIDAERAYMGDPASDWVLLLYGVPDAFWKGYGNNIVEKRDPVCINIYKGMYFIVNILEASRFQQSDAQPRQWLAAVNTELLQGT